MDPTRINHDRDARPTGERDDYLARSGTAG
jgi:hypothetical protein